MIELENYSTLRLLCWNQRSGFVSRQDAFSIYERNWRFVEKDKLTDSECPLVDELTESDIVQFAIQLAKDRSAGFTTLDSGLNCLRSFC